jgi:thiol-disulfide isomerase/thioredoxin
LAEKYTVTFTNKEGKTSQAVGIFKQNGHLVTGSFLTPTGDYRYLAGVIDSDSLKLSTFDGTHLYLLKGKLNKEGFKANFWSNITSKSTIEATINPTASLPDPSSLTYLKPNAPAFGFSFPQANGQVISLGDQRFQGKVVVVQLLGTWCPNCMDETKYLAPWYLKNKARGIEVVGLAFEKTADLAESGPKIENMKKRFGVDYPVLLAGSNDKALADAALPMLNGVKGYPTTLFIDKKGVLRHIHTGFSGPGTGKYYLEWMDEFNALIDKLSAE